ncbi:MAG: biotin transporter BioY [Clostridiales bacterium]|nr:biotin transporter BioY [Clostridiales bacterium]
MKTKDMAIVALCTALIALGAFIKIPLPTVALTLQWFFVMAAADITGKGRSSLSAGLYVILGLIGLPVFTTGGGFWSVLSPTFGYSLGFILTAFLIGLMAEKGMNLFAANAIGTVILYVIGGTYGYVILNFFTEGNGIALKDFFWAFMILPLPGDIIKIVVAAIVSKRVKKAVGDI